MKQVIFGCFLCAIVFSACSDEPEVNNALLVSHTPLVQQVFYSDDSLFHGISLGMTQAEVKKALAPGDSITEESQDYLFAEGSFDAQKTYSWACEFDSAGLYAITLDIYLQDEENATEWYKDITAYFTDKYGAGTDDGVALTWEIKNGKRPARAELVEEMGYGYGKLTVYYYDLDFVPLEGDTLPPEADSFFLPSDNVQ
jgi:hypothetical protein